MTYRALIPVKTLGEAKSRLATYLTQDERSMLVLDMLYHVIRVLRESYVFESIAVVSADRHVLEQATAWGTLVHLEEQHGHNPALHAAALKERATGATALLTISADLPLLQSDDIRCMVAHSWSHDVVLAPTQDNTGTNALLVRPPLALSYLFGPGSLQRYLSEAKERHLSSMIYSSIGLSLDIDTKDDLAMFRRYEARRNGRHVS